LNSKNKILITKAGKIIAAAGKMRRPDDAALRIPARRLWLIVLGAMLLFWNLGVADAGDLSHYAPGASNLRDLFAPLDKGAQFRFITYYYSAETFKDEHGRTINSVNVAGRPFPLEISLSSLSFVPVFIWSPDWKPLGADVGMFAALPIHQVSSSTRLTNVFSGVVSEDNQRSSGLGDFRIQPLWLTWRLTRFNIGMAYALYAPTGKHDSDSSANTGLGSWSHQFQAPFAVHFDDAKSLSLVGAATYELNHEKSDAHLTPGSHFTMNYGLSKLIPCGKGLFDLAALGYSQWQVTDDSGPGVNYDASVHDRVHALGVQILYSHPSRHSMAAFKYLKEYGAIDRPRGDVFVLTLMYRF